MGLLGIMRFVYFLKRRKGFTLIEAFTALIVLGISAAALLASLYMGLNIVNDVREHVIASSIIQEEMEVLRKTSFAALPATGTDTIQNIRLDQLSNANGSITVGNYIDSDSKRISIVVTWDSPLDPNRHNTKRAVTIFTKDGINSI